MTRRILTILFLVVVSITADAQAGYNNLKAADAFYAKGDYYSAAVYYEKYLANDKLKALVENPYVVQKDKNGAPSKKLSTKPQAIYNLAESYRKLYNYAKAEPYYAQVSNNAAFPLAAYWHGISLRALEKYDSSLMVLQKFVASYTTDDEYLKGAKKEIANLQFIQVQAKPGKKQKYTVSKAGFNKEGATYAPTWKKDELVITSTMPDSSVKLAKNQSPYNNKLYSINDNGFNKLSIPNADSKQFGVGSFTADGKKIFFTRWVNVDGKNVSAIYTSELNEVIWSEPKIFDTNYINIPGFSAKQPFVTADGKTLYFSSNKPGGYGKFDLYAVALTVASMPVSLGAINTDGDDEAPFYSNNTLVFSSNGRVGMGGFDLFYAKGNGSIFSAPVNFGTPINSIKDDIYFTAKADGKSGMFLSSDRASECCLQLFSIEKIPSDKFITGKVVDCDTKAPLSGASVTITDSVANTVAFNVQTDVNGTYSIVVPEYKAYIAKASKDGYKEGKLSFNAPYDAEMDTLYNPALCLVPIPAPIKDTIPITTTGKDSTIIVLNAVYFDFDKSNLTATSKQTLDQVVKTMKDNPQLIVEVNGHADEKGTDLYNLDLSMKRAKACFSYLVSKGIKVSRLQLKASGESDPAAPNSVDGKDNPDGRKLNRRTEFKVPRM